MTEEERLLRQMLGAFTCGYELPDGKGAWVKCGGEAMQVTVLPPSHSYPVGHVDIRCRRHRY